MLYVGPGAYHYAVDRGGQNNRLSQQAPQDMTIYIQSTTNRLLQDQTKFLYCEYDWK